MAGQRQRLQTKFVTPMKLMSRLLIMRGRFAGFRKILIFAALAAFPVSNILPQDQAFVSSSNLSAEDIENDIRDYQQYFLQRFAATSLADFAKGAYGLPQFSDQKFSRDLLSIIPPYQHNLDKIRHQFTQSIDGQGSIAECMQRYPEAQQFPFAFNGEIITVENAINRCLVALGKSALSYHSDKLNRLSAVFREAFKGKPRQSRYADNDLKKAFQLGRHLFWSKRGQQNFSCASCHVKNAGNRLAERIISASLGQSGNFPLFSPGKVQRLQKVIRSSNTSWVSLHDQYALCFIRSGAAPLPPQSADYQALEVYQAVMDTAVPIQAPAFRSY